MKYLYVILIFVAGTLFGMWVVKNDIQHNCEEIGNIDGSRWLECDQVIK